MPIYEILCHACGYAGEVIEPADGDQAKCPSCGGRDTEKRISPTSSLTGKSRQAHPGPKDTACCGSTPSSAGCAGPGSCCGHK